jgi:hypothetical protein
MVADGVETGHAPAEGVTDEQLEGQARSIARQIGGLHWTLVMDVLVVLRARGVALGVDPAGEVEGRR